MEFGTVQLQRYTEQIQVAIRELEAKGADAPLLKSRDDIHPGMHTYPLARTGKGSPHHFTFNLTARLAETPSLFFEYCTREWIQQSSFDLGVTIIVQLVMEKGVEKKPSR